MDLPIIYILQSGGPVMVALAALSVLMYQALIGLLVFVRRVKLDDPAGEGMASALSAHRGRDAAGDAEERLRLDVAVIDETLWRFKQLVRGRLKYSQALLAAAPLLGLLGTVMGMLDTFQGLSLQLGQETSRAVADGISRALITTETGLMVAIPALFLIHWIKRETRSHELRIMDRRMQLLAAQPLT